MIFHGVGDGFTILGIYLSLTLMNNISKWYYDAIISVESTAKGEISDIIDL